MAISIIRMQNEVPSIESPEFIDRYFKPQKPVLIKNLVSSFEAGKKWSMEFFERTMGNHKVGVFDNSPIYLDRSYKRALKIMRFADYLRMIQSGPCDARLFLFDPFKLNPSLLKDFNFPKVAGIRFLKRFPFMFFGGSGSIVRIHQDMDFNPVFLMQFHGRKRVVLFEPRYSDLLYRYPFNVHAEVDVDHPDYQKYPALQFVQGYEYMLEKGDALLIPGGWWHHIEYLEGGFAMSFRALNPNFKMLARGIWNVGVLTNVDDLMRKIFDKKWFDYKRQRAHTKAELAVKRLVL